MMGVFAEFERAMIQERVRAGLRRANRTKDRAGVRVIAAAHGVSVNTVQRIAHAR